MFNQMHPYFSVHDLYYHGQIFREKHSTQHAALELIDRIAQELDRGNIPINIYIDLSKAFDTLNHEILISKLKYYGINGSAPNLTTVRKRVLPIELRRKRSTPLLSTTMPN